MWPMTRLKDRQDHSLPAWIIDAETPAVEAPLPRLGLDLPAVCPLDEDPQAAQPLPAGGTVIIFDL